MMTVDTSSYTPSPSPALEEPLSDGRYVQPSTFKCSMSEKITAPDSFVVKVFDTKEVIYEVKGERFSFEAQKRLFDSDGDILFSMRADITSWLSEMYLKDFRNNARYTVRKKGFLPGMGRGTLQVFTQGRADPIVEIFTNGQRTISKIVNSSNNAVMATINRKAFSAKRLFRGLDSYVFRVQPGVDIPIIVMLAVCFDEHYTEGGF